MCRSITSSLLCALLFAGALACSREPPVPRPVPPQPSAPVAVAAPPAAALPAEDTATALALGPTVTDFTALGRAEFNALAAEEDLPLYWRADDDGDRTLDAAELAVLWPAEPREWLQSGRLTASFGAAYGLLLARQDPTPPGQTPEEKRRALVLAELRQGRPTLIAHDFRALPADERAFVEHVLQAAVLVEQLFALQSGTAALAAELPPHRPSRALFHRNQGPWCEAPQTEKDPDCNALPARPPKRSGLYPPHLQEDPEFCEKWAALPNGEALAAPFVAVREDERGALRAVPYSEAWREPMLAVAAELRAAAEALAPQKREEAALVAYLRAAAQAFVDDSWFAADEAWARMEGKSRWYLRIGPDETYHEPCARKAGFHVSFARVDLAALAWQRRLEPIKSQLEAAVAELAGPPYKSGATHFHLPSFVDIVLNAGDSRSALGATVGQSLPNWGPVANESRGRTVAMANLYTDADSQAAMRVQVNSLFCAESAPRVPTDPESLVMTTVLHEAGHNLGPAHEYKVDGKVDDAIFGGPLAATLEELKAETAALFLADWLVAHGKLEAAKRDAGQAAGVAWAMGHIAQGMQTASGKPKPYSQLSAVQVGTLLDAKALTWHDGRPAANGKDLGCLNLNPGRMAPAVRQLMAQVAGVKARGDRAGAEALLAPYIGEATTFAQLRSVIRERWLRVPKPAFVYAIRTREE